MLFVSVGCCVVNSTVAPAVLQSWVCSIVKQIIQTPEFTKGEENNKPETFFSVILLIFQLQECKIK